MRRRPRRRAHEIRKTGEVVFAVEHQRIALLVCQHVLAERSAERGEALVDIGEPRLRRGVKRSAGAGKFQVIALEHAPLLGRKRKPVAHLVETIDAAEQGLVHEDPVPVLGLERGELALDREDRIVGVSAGEEIENVDRPRERLSARLERVDGVGEGRRVRIAGNGRDLSRVRGKCAGKGRPEMLGLDPAEGCHAEGAAPLREQRVVAGFGGEDLGLLIHIGHMGCERVHCTLSDDQGQSTSASLHVLNFSDVKEAPR